MSSRVKRKKWCVFPNCDHAALKGTFQFPSKLEEDRRSKWLVECKLTEANVTQDSRICTRHFRPSDIQKSNNRVYLKPGSIPTFYTADEYFESVENEVIHEEILDHSHLQPKQNVPVLSLTNSSPKKSDLIIDNDHSYFFRCQICHSICEDCVQKDQQIKGLKDDVINLRRKFHNLEVKYQELKNLPHSDSPKGKKFREDITKQRMIENGHFSETQVNVYLRYDKEKNPHPRSRKWSSKDLLLAKQIQSIGTKALEFARINLGVPLPSETCLYEKFKFMKIERGYVKPSILYLKSLMPRLSPSERLGAIKFDEMKIKETAIYDSRLDCLFGPNKYVQEILVRGIFGKWQYPIYIDYDMALTKSHYMECVLHLEAIGLKVLISSCDQGPRNISLANDLGINSDNVSVPNPYDESRFVLFVFDWVHIFKNIRNHFLDDFFKLLSEDFVFSKDDFEELLTKVNGVCLKMINLKPMHINCQQSDRQNVRLAKELLSESVSILLKELFPECPKKQKLSEIVFALDQAWNVLTSKNAESSDFSKCAFRAHLEQQLSCLNDLSLMFEDMEFMKRDGKNPKWGKIPSQKNAQITIKGVIKLQEILSEKYGEPKFGAEITTQDDLEREFGINRGHGNDRNPSALQFNDRTCNIVIQSILKDVNFDIFSLEEMIEKCDCRYDYDYWKVDPKENLPKNARKITKTHNSTWETQEKYWVAGILSFRFKDDENLKSSGPIAASPGSLLLTKSIKQGTILTPSERFLEDVERMYKLFSNHHPLPYLRPGPGLHSNFVEILVHEFPNYKIGLLEAFTEIRTNLQIKAINLLTKEGKTKTLRGARNLAETINS